ncbi:MAG TPA: nucleotide exchange factor GrpE, partial [Patescibacteria group bacterium]|nr:nucleotide exchange factor GrpE [Patescibacteria group bacterium]
MTTRKHSHDPGSAPDEKSEVARPAHSHASADARLQEKIAELESALAEARDRHLRLAADFDNYKKRSRQEHLDTIQHASAELISRLLPAIDDL